MENRFILYIILLEISFKATDSSLSGSVKRANESPILAHFSSALFANASPLDVKGQIGSFEMYKHLLSATCK